MKFLTPDPSSKFEGFWLSSSSGTMEPHRCYIIVVFHQEEYHYRYPRLSTVSQFHNQRNSYYSLEFPRTCCIIPFFIQSFINSLPSERSESNHPEQRKGSMSRCIFSSGNCRWLSFKLLGNLHM